MTVAVDVSRVVAEALVQSTSPQVSISRVVIEVIASRGVGVLTWNGIKA